MARNVPDDFSFLPTVDSVDEEHAIKEELWAKKPPVQEDVTESSHAETAFPPDEHPIEEMGDDAAGYEEPQAAEQSPPIIESAQLSIKTPPPANKVRVFEPDVSDHGHRPEVSTEARQDGRAMWEAFESEHGPDAPTVVTPRVRIAPAPEMRDEFEPVIPRRAEPAGTPAVSLGRKADRRIAPAAPVALTIERPVESGPPPLPREAAPVPETEETQIHTGLAADPEAPPADNSDVLKEAKKRAIILTIGVHVVVILVMLLMHVPMMDLARPEIVATSAVEQLENESWKKVTAPPPQASPMAASVSPLLSTGVSDIAMPELDFSASANDLNLGTSFGSFGSGVTTGGAGGKVSFLGNTATAKHVVFVVDVSGSMSASMNVAGSGTMSRFDLLKKELSKSLSAMAAGTAYEVIFFSDFAWPHDTVDSNDMRALNDYDWKITPTSKNVSIPRFSYLATNSANIAKSKKIIAEANNPGGTNWGSGLMMALKASPKPDVIFFMTDGNRSDEQGWIDVISTENSRGKRTIIHTTALGTPDAAKDLAAMARRNGGKFTAVMADGKILQEKELLK